MNVIKISPRGYCYGVVDAMVLATQVAKREDLPRPIYILGMIVHNQYVVDAFTKLGIETLDGADRLRILEPIEHGTVIFTAHGISQAVRDRAREKGLTVIDATCPDVTRTHALIEAKTKDGYDVIYIGKHGHPEPEGAIGVRPDAVYLVEHEKDIEQLPKTIGYRASTSSRKILVTNQTTMSQWDTKALVDAIRKTFPEAEIYNEICLATQVRQDAVATQAKEADVCIVVGDPRSNNSGRLAQVAREIVGIPSYRVSDVSEIDPAWLKGCTTVAVTSGASTPTAITKEVITYLEAFDEKVPATWLAVSNVDIAHLLPTIKE